MADAVSVANQSGGSPDSDTLSVRRHRLLAWLAAERGALDWSLLDLDARTLTEFPVFETSNWSVKDLLAHVAAWDRWQHQTMAALLTGDQPDFAAAADWDVFNAAAVAAWRDRTLAEVISEMRAARSAWVEWIRQVPLHRFFQTREVDGWDWTFPGCLQVQWEHDAEHAAQLATWRAEQTLMETGPKAVLVTALHAARDELLTAVNLVPAEERSSRPVCGEWTSKDVVGHQADWEQLGVVGLRDMAAGRPPDIASIPDVDAWNARHVAARRDQTWQNCWSDLRETREDLLRVIERTPQDTLDRSYLFPWGPESTAYRWVRVFAKHDREHALDLRRAMEVGEPPGAAGA